MSDVQIRDDRAGGRLEAFAGDELAGHIQYFVLASPRSALVPVHTIVESAYEGQGVAGSLATRLGVAEADDHDSADPRFGIYDWLGYRLDGLVGALDDEE